MVHYLVHKIKPGKGFAHFFHISFIAILPPVLWVLIRIDLFGVAIAVMLLSKWRMLALHPRHWIAHLRTNAVDIIVSLSFIIFMAQSSGIYQALWVLLFEVWLLYIKPGTSDFLITTQAFISQSFGLISLFLAIENGSLLVYVLAFWLISYFSARHFLAIFEDVHGNLIASIWAFFAACFAWTLGHWLLFFGPIAQPAALISVLAGGLAGIYYLDQNDRLSTTIRRQILVMMFAIVFVIIVFSDWGDKAV